MMSVVLVVLKWLIIIVLASTFIIAVLTLLFVKIAPTFGARPDKHTLARIKASPNFNGKTFVNLTGTHASTINMHSMLASGAHDKPKSNSQSQFQSKPKGQDGAQNNHILLQFLFPPKGKNPDKPIHTEPLRLIADNDDQRNKQAVYHSTSYHPDTTLKEGEFVWLGHSTILFKTAGKTLITDPLFHRASPVPLGGKPFAMTHTPKASDLPYIDIVLISHDHYDHLDHRAIQQIKHKVGHFHVPLGVKAHLVRWGVAEQNISEYDWYESALIKNNENNNENDDDENSLDKNDIEITFTPARHFSGRSITGHRTTLWGSWVVQSPQLKVFFSGDGGYFDEFAKIGKHFDGFDVAFIEDGAYNERWQDVHMLPEDSAQAGIDVGAKVIVPIHWGKFDLSTHHWREPVRRIKNAINNHNKNNTDAQSVALATPRIGEVFDLGNLPSRAWWEEEG